MKNSDLSKTVDEEIEPPWVKYPGFPPGDGFWRQAGEAWLTYVWQPYWDSLKDEQRDVYLERWNVPKEWRSYYFDTDFQQWLAEIDDE